MSPSCFCDLSIAYSQRSRTTELLSTLLVSADPATAFACPAGLQLVEQEWAAPPHLRLARP